MTDSLDEKLQSHAEYLRHIGEQEGTTVPGSRDRRVWISPDKAKEIAGDIEDRLAEFTPWEIGVGSIAKLRAAHERLAASLANLGQTFVGADDEERESILARVEPWVRGFLRSVERQTEAVTEDTRVIREDVGRLKNEMKTLRVKLCD